MRKKALVSLRDLKNMGKKSYLTGPKLLNFSVYIR